MTRGWVSVLLWWLERLFFLAGVVCLVSVYATWKHVLFHKVHAKAAIQHMVTATVNPSAPGGSDVSDSSAREGSLIGVLEIPRLAVSVAVLEGTDDRALALAVGHVRSTPLPWEEGNSALAGHRDTFFRPLKELRTGDRLQLVTTHGTFEYRVSHLVVVQPHDLWVLDGSGDASLTLITCYPFHYVGSAPRRFVVRARRVGRP